MSDRLEPRPVSASRTVMARAMLPSDANPWGNVHGGEIMKLIDSCAGAAAQRHARSRVVTARIDELSFVAPVFVGDLVTAKASVNEVGRTSMEVGVRVEAENTLTGRTAHVASAHLVFVAIDEQGRPIAIPPVLPETDEERRRMVAAKARRGLRLERPGRPVPPGAQTEAPQRRGRARYAHGGPYPRGRSRGVPPSQGRT